MISRKLSIVTFTAALLLSGASYARELNIGNQSTHPVVPPVGGGSGNGISVLGGSFDASGTAIVGIGTTVNATHSSTGTYHVVFRRVLTGCVWTGSVGNGTFSGAPQGTVDVTGDAGNNKGLFVQTFNSAGTITDEPFEVNVICG